jgi:putative hydrolase of the HAD superfamily
MPASPTITTLFLDIGGVLLTNGWDRKARQLAAGTFGLDYEEMNERHHLSFDTYELGKLSLDEYLTQVVFHRERPFTRQAFKEFMLAQSQPYPQMIALIKALKARFHLKLVAVSNEGRELSEYRISHFHLAEFIDIFISSSFVHFRKPDVDIYGMALDAVQAAPGQIVYLDDRDLFIEVAENLGIRGICHRSLETTQDLLSGLGLSR